MAKKCLIEKHKRQAERWARYEEKKRKLLEENSDKAKEQLAELEAQRIKNRLFKARQYNRCSVTGRAHGYFRFFGVSRHVLREMAHKGQLPGVKKASW